MARPNQGYCNRAGDTIPGTTTICEVVKESGGLIQWAYKTGREHERLVSQGKPAPRHLYDVVEKAANIGTLAHACCEADIRGEPLPVIPAELAGPVAQAYGQFLAWKHQTRLKIVDTEISLISEQYQYGGTLDFVCEIDGVLCLGDFKTSGGIYPEMLMQLAAYRQLWNENYPDRQITGPSHLLRISKEAPDFAHHSYGDLDDPWRLFLCAREAYALRRKVKRRAA